MLTELNKEREKIITQEEQRTNLLHDELRKVKEQLNDSEQKLKQRQVIVVDKTPEKVLYQFTPNQPILPVRIIRETEAMKRKQPKIAINNKREQLNQRVKRRSIERNGLHEVSTVEPDEQVEQHIQTSTTPIMLNEEPEKPEEEQVQPQHTQTVSTEVPDEQQVPDEQEEQVLHTLTTHRIHLSRKTEEKPVYEYKLKTNDLNSIDYSNLFKEAVDKYEFNEQNKIIQTKPKDYYALTKNLWDIKRYLVIQKLYVVIDIDELMQHDLIKNSVLKTMYQRYNIPNLDIFVRQMCFKVHTNRLLQEAVDILINTQDEYREINDKLID
jgi:hypothetical protein